jgi:hypothetical protein
MVDSTERVLDKITVDLYNKKVVVRGDEGSTVTFRASSINELVDLIGKCKELVKTEYVTVR